MVILQLAIILIASKIAGSLSVRLGQPSVLGKLLIGIVLGPSVLGLVNETETLAEFSQIGVILLMFIAGLETDLEEFKRTGKGIHFCRFWRDYCSPCFRLFCGNHFKSNYDGIMVFRFIAFGDKCEYIRSST